MSCGGDLWFTSSSCNVITNIPKLTKWRRDYNKKSFITSLITHSILSFWESWCINLSEAIEYLSCENSDRGEETAANDSATSADSSSTGAVVELVSFSLFLDFEWLRTDANGRGEPLLVLLLSTTIDIARVCCLPYWYVICWQPWESLLAELQQLHLCWWTCPYAPIW